MARWLVKIFFGWEGKADRRPVVMAVAPPKEEDGKAHLGAVAAAAAGQRR